MCYPVCWFEHCLVFADVAWHPSLSQMANILFHPHACVRWMHPSLSLCIQNKKLHLSISVYSTSPCTVLLLISCRSPMYFLPTIIFNALPFTFFSLIHPHALFFPMCALCVLVSFLFSLPIPSCFTQDTFLAVFMCIWVMMTSWEFRRIFVKAPSDFKTYKLILLDISFYANYCF